MSEQSTYEIWSEATGTWIPAWSIKDDAEMKRLNKIARRDIYRRRSVS